MKMNKTKKIEEILAQIHPKFLLDHYWNILDLINWRVFVNLEDKEYFTISDLREKITEEINSPPNPFHLRRSLRSKEVIEEVVSELVNTGLLIKEDGKFKITDILSKFCYLLKKKFQANLRSYVVWGLWYLYNRGSTSFSTAELVSLLSYPERDLCEELPHLGKWKEEQWFELLKKKEDRWTLIEEPHPSKSILIRDIYNRLFTSISNLSKDKNEFHGEEIISTLRELEQNSAERILKNAGLKCEKDIWEIDEVALKIIKILLRVPAKWPSFGHIISTKRDFKYFKLQSKQIYVDIPTTFFQGFLGELGGIGDNDPEKAYEKARELAVDYNRNLEREIGGWLRFVVTKQFSGYKDFGIQLRIYWDKFNIFLDDFAEKELGLGEKYSYILACRAPSLQLILRGNLTEVQDKVKEICEEEITLINQKINDLTEKIEEYRDYLLKIARRRKTIPIDPLTLYYFPEMLSILNTFPSIVENGAITSCYREMRKILENLSWVIFDDLLFYRRKITRDELLSPYRFVSKEWYDWASQNQHMIRNLGQLKKEIKGLSEEFYLYGKRRGYNWNEKKIIKTSFERISYPTFLMLIKADAPIPKKMEGVVPQYEVKTLRDLAILDLENIIKDLKHKRLSKSDEEFIDKLSEKLGINSPKLIPLYPSNDFVIGFVSKVSSINLQKLYNEYSHFIHSYFTSWHIFPFSSVLEFKIYKHQLLIFNDAILSLMNYYFGLFSQHGIKSFRDKKKVENGVM
ncbi:MAG TPA: hypothetical protein VMW40_05300 [Candidatus Bathyarchaeia archaeon]|nr:hypothetical protein [Candidatus Bathyarchaeia archaeon]